MNTATDATGATVITITRAAAHGQGSATRYRCDVAAMTVELIGGRGCPAHKRLTAIPADAGVGDSVMREAARKLGFRAEYNVATKTVSFVR